VLFQNFAVLELASNYLQMFLHRHQYQVTNENEYLRGYGIKSFKTDLFLGKNTNYSL
jgi:hypothetical protein